METDGKYEVEAVADHRVKADNGIELFIKWKHYDPKYNTWEPIGNVYDDITESVDSYFEHIGLKVVTKSTGMDKIYTLQQLPKRSRSSSRNRSESRRKRSQGRSLERSSSKEKVLPFKI